jgi:hypothetical protein
MCEFMAVSVRDGYTEHMTGYDPRKDAGPNPDEPHPTLGTPRGGGLRREDYQPPPIAVSVRAESRAHGSPSGEFAALPMFARPRLGRSLGKG